MNATMSHGRKHESHPREKTKIEERRNRRKEIRIKQKTKKLEINCLGCFSLQSKDNNVEDDEKGCTKKLKNQMLKEEKRNG